MLTERLHDAVKTTFTDAARRYGLMPLRMAVDEVNEILDDEMRTANKAAGAQCAIGCDHCCHRLIPATNLEVALIMAEVSEWEQERQDALHERLKTYETDTRLKRVNPPLMIRTTCPFLLDKKCEIYDLRPLCCQGQSSTDAEACKRWKENPQWGEHLPRIEPVDALAQAAGSGEMEGLQLAGAQPSMLDLGLASKFLLENQDLIHIVARDARPAIQAAWTPGLRDVEGEPSGLRPLTPEVSAAVQDSLWWKPGAGERMPEQGMDAHRALLMLQTPIAYENEDQVNESRDWYMRALDRFCELDFDSGDVFDALGRYHALTLPCQGYSDKLPHRKLGEFVTKHSRKLFPEITSPMESKAQRGKLKVGFLGGSLWNHHGGKWALGYLNPHPEDVEVYALHLGQEYDRFTEQWRMRSDHFYQLLGSVPEIARFVKSLDLDVIVFCGPHGFARNKQFATFRMAPVQVSTWGTPFTPGFPEITHFIASDCMEPDNAEEHYSEKLIRLPGFHLCYERSQIPEPEPLDVDKLGPGPHALIAQIPNKLMPRRDEMFKRVADALGRSLLIIDHEDRASAIVRERFEKADIPLTWIKPMPHPQFMSLLKGVDMSLDTPDWNGGNTTLEAYTVGTPVITIPGDLMRGRHTYGFLKVMGAEDMAAKDVDEYVEMAKNSGDLAERLKTLPLEMLFDEHEATKRFFDCLKGLAGWK